ncbi:hypothetical protein KAI87_15330, partial [Myxococcota bacterium]|nr:hypothetical protein [Myxococcota bacterium]
ITAIDGPIALTQCSNGEMAGCEIAIDCPVRNNWKTINDKVLDALSDLSLADMTGPLPEEFVHNQKTKQQEKQKAKLTQIGSR